MSDAFDPYHKWLGISPAEQPPHHYRLLGIVLYESDPDVIENAADQRMSHLRGFQTGRNAEHSQRLLNEVSAAKVCLLSAEKKAEYDAQLRSELDGRSSEAASTYELADLPPAATVAAVEAQPVFTPPAIPTRRRAAQWWLVPVMVGAGAVLVLLLGLAFLAARRHSGGAAASDDTASNAAKLPPPPAPTLEPVDDAADDAGDDTASNAATPAPPPAPTIEPADDAADDAAAPAPPTPDILAAIQAAAEAGDVRRTALAGSQKGGSPGEDVPAAHGLLVGMKLTFSHIRGSPVIVMTSVQGIFQTSEGTAPGTQFGRRYRISHRVDARPGYAVGAIDVKARGRVNGIRVVFMRVDGDRLNPDDSYESKWMGGTGTPQVRLGGDGNPVIGLRCRRGVWMDALGLVQAATQ